MAVRRMLVAGRYRLHEPVGSGGMGRVWLARDEMLDRDVAIKEFVPPDWMTYDERDKLRVRTLREARSAARLNHPNVVQIHDVVHADGLPWIVMEYVPSRSLQQILRQDGPLDPPAVALIGLRVLDALTAAHSAGVLHRDVKPHNVLIGDDARVVLTDFGLATFVDDGGMTQPGLIVGSPQYVSPERARDGSSTAESDLWSLGATLYAAVEGRSPYARDTAMATLLALATEPPDPLVRAGPLEPVLLGLLRHDPAQRLPPPVVAEGLRRARDSGVPILPIPSRSGTRATTPPADGRRPARRIGRAVVPPPRRGDAPVRDHTAAPADRVDHTTADEGAAGERGAVGSREDPRRDGAAARVPPAGDDAVARAADATVLASGQAHHRAVTSWAPALADSGPGRVVDAAMQRPVAGPPRRRAPRPATRLPAPPSTMDEEPDRAPPPVRAVPVAFPVTLIPTIAAPPGRAGRRARSFRFLIGAVAAGMLAAAAAVVLERQPGDEGARPSGVVSATEHGPGRPAPGTGGSGTAPVGIGPAAASGGSAVATPGRGPAPTTGGVPAGGVPAAGASAGGGGRKPGGPAPARAGGGATEVGGFGPQVCGHPGRLPRTPRPGARRITADGYALPAGWSYHRDSAGFAVAVPNGWTYRRAGSTVCFGDPGGVRVLSVDVARSPAADPIRACRREADRLAAVKALAGYRALVIRSVPYFDKAADWEYRYRDRAGVALHANVRWFAADDRAYAVGWLTRELDWRVNRAHLDLIVASLRPLPAR